MLFKSGSSINHDLTKDHLRLGCVGLSNASVWVCCVDNLKGLYRGSGPSTGTLGACLCR